MYQSSISTLSTISGLFRKNRIPDPEFFWPTRSKNLFVLKHIQVKVSITCKFQPNWSNNTLKSGFFRISGKTGSRIRNFFGLKPSRDQDGANKKKFSQIGPAVPEEIGHRQTDRHRVAIYKGYVYMYMYIYIYILYI